MMREIFLKKFRESRDRFDLYELSKEVAKRRYDIHLGQLSQQQLTNTSELTGVFGECILGKIIRIDPDFSDRICGDKYDFLTILGPLDVKTRESTFPAMLVKQSSIQDNYIYVCGQYFNKLVFFRGWSYGWETKKYDTVPMKSGMNHQHPHNQLRNMNDLFEQLDIPFRYKEDTRLVKI